MKSNTRLLDLDQRIEHVEVGFYPDEWDEFDLAVGWLVANGVAMYHGYEYDENRAMVHTKKNYPYAGGKLVNSTLDGSGPKAVQGEESGVQYVVYKPDHIR